MADTKKQQLPLSLHEAAIARHYARDPRTREIVEDQELGRCTLRWSVVAKPPSTRATLTKKSCGTR